MPNKIYLVLPAKDIPDSTPVRKVKGEVVYTLRKRIEIYGEGDKKVFAEEGINYLVGDNSINSILDNRQLAIDFGSLEQLREFIDELESFELEG